MVISIVYSCSVLNVFLLELNYDDDIFRIRCSKELKISILSYKIDGGVRRPMLVAYRQGRKLTMV